MTVGPDPVFSQAAEKNNAKQLTRPQGQGVSLPHEHCAEFTKTTKIKFKIGEFSKLNRVTVKTLRHYEEIGLLVPEPEWTSGPDTVITTYASWEG